MEGRGGCQCSQRHALPLHREMAKWWKSWVVLDDDDDDNDNEVVLWEMALPMALMA